MPTNRGCKDCDDGGGTKLGYLVQDNLQTKESLLQLTHDIRKPLFQAVSAYLLTGNSAGAASLHCIKDGTNIDYACGSGSLLLKFAKILGKENVRLGFSGQEINITKSNLCRINMFLHDIDYDKFHIGLADTLTEPLH